MKDNTRVNHPPVVNVPADNRPLVAPIYQSVKFSFDNTAETQRFLRGEQHHLGTHYPPIRQRI